MSSEALRERGHFVYYLLCIMSICQIVSISMKRIPDLPLTYSNDLQIIMLDVAHTPANTDPGP